MPKAVIVIGDFGMDEKLLNSLFSSVFCTEPVMLKNGFEMMKNFSKVSKADYSFVRIDYPMIDGLYLTRRIREKYPSKKLVWAAKDGGYAMSGFEEGVDAFLELPVTKEGLEEVRKRLSRLGESAAGCGLKQAVCE